MSSHFDAQIRKAKSRNKQILFKLQQRLVNVGVDTDDAILLVCLNILERSLYYCPIDTGRLRASAFLKRTRSKTAVGGVAGGVKAPGSSKYTIGYSPSSKSGDFIIKPDAFAFYAWFVHEIIENRTHKPPTQAKFLEQAMNEHINKFVPAIMKAVKGKGFKRGGARGRTRAKK